MGSMPPILQTRHLFGEALYAESIERAASPAAIVEWLRQAEPLIPKVWDSRIATQDGTFRPLKRAA